MGNCTSKKSKQYEQNEPLLSYDTTPYFESESVVIERLLDMASDLTVENLLDKIYGQDTKKYDEEMNNYVMSNRYLYLQDLLHIYFEKHGMLGLLKLEYEWINLTY